MDDTKPVKEFYEIDEEELEDKSEENSYWMSCYKFYKDIKNRPAKTLSTKQAQWLSSIEEKLNE